MRSGKDFHLILFGRLLQIGLEKTKKALLLLLHQCGYTSMKTQPRAAVPQKFRKQ